MDCTGSMGAYIKSVRNNVSAIASKLAHGEKCDVRFAMVAYRDHPPQEKSFISKTFDFTHSASVMENYLSQVSAAGGGDGPEAVDAALQGCLELPWRKDAAKICVLIADAPPHGLGEAGDGFPNGVPDTEDPLETVDRMANNGIVIYSVGCNPALRSYAHAERFMMAIAQKTGGSAVDLRDAASLADVITGAAVEESDLTSLMPRIEAKIEEIRLAYPEADEEEVSRSLYRSLAAEGCTTRKLETPVLKASNAELLTKASKLSDVREELAKLPRSRSASPTGMFPDPSFDGEGVEYRSLGADTDSGACMYRSLGASGGDSCYSKRVCIAPPAHPKVEISEGEISLSQVARMVSRSLKAAA